MRRARLLGLALVVVAVASAATWLSFERADDSRRRDERREAVLAWERAITQPAKDGGFVIQNGMKPAVADLGRDMPGQTMFQAVGWVAELERVRGVFAQAVPPPSLRDAAADFDAALRMYREAAETLGAAAISAGDTRRTLLDRAVAKAQEADATYDRASAALQRIRRLLGLGPSPNFPDKG